MTIILIQQTHDDIDSLDNNRPFGHGVERSLNFCTIERVMARQNGDGP